MARKDIRQDQIMQAIAGGRSPEEQVAYIKKEGNLGGPTALRNRLLGAMDVLGADRPAENMIVWGCYIPFRLPLSVRAYVTLLDRLGIDWTFLEKEYCCGLPMVEMAQGEKRDEMVAAARELLGLNLSRGRELGAKRVVYYCVWCAYLAKKILPEETLEQVYFPDLVLEKLQQRHLKVSPTVVGYYEGCHRRNRDWAAGVRMNWKGYRALLDRIEGLKVVDLPRGVCCVDAPESIVEKALEQNVTTIVCSCPACQIRVGAAGRGKVEMKYYPELLLEALQGEVAHTAAPVAGGAGQPAHAEGCPYCA